MTLYIYVQAGTASLHNLVRSEIQIFQYIDTKYHDFVTQISDSTSTGRSTIVQVSFKFL